MRIKEHLILTSLVLCGVSGTIYGQSAGQNYVRTRTPRTAIRTEAKLDQLTGNKDSVQSTVAYFDGLGRPLQTVQVKGNPDGTKDIVQPISYDLYGRETYKYLPFAYTGSADGSYRSDAISKQALFYNPTGNGQSGAQQGNGIPVIPTAYSQTVFEASPLNRVSEQGAPGNAWQPGTRSNSSGRTVMTVYTYNNQTGFSSTPLSGNAGSRKVVLYSVSSTGTLVRASNNAVYSNNQLYVTITRNENWVEANGCLNTMEEYKDKEGRMLLKRTYNNKSGVVEMLSTYYVHDDYGNLRYVLPPGSEPDMATGVPSQSVLSGLCYQYRYDGRNRVVEKKVPGKGWEYIVYNSLDQVVATQDSVQRMKNPQQASFTKYDALGRVIITGVYNIPNSGTAGVNLRTSIQNAFNGQQVLWEKRKDLGEQDSTDYTNQSLPQSGRTDLVINYYDRYDKVYGLQTVGRPANASTMTQGLLTASRTAVLNTPTQMLWTVNHYDDDGRVIAVFKQHYKGGQNTVKNYDLISTTYNFNDQPTTVSRRHVVYNTATTNSEYKFTVFNRYQYDHMGRKTTTLQRITDAGQTNDNEVMLSRQEYNEVGQLKTKYLHSTDTSSLANFKQTISYKYNERGWLKNQDAGVFGMQLNYNEASNPQFNGNISEQIWINPGSPNPNRSYAYSYDNLNRLTAGMGTGGYSEQGIVYDKMGNIQQLTRYDNNVKIDELAYTYTANSNQLTTVTDQTTENTGLRSGTFSYTYDGNGNMLRDPSRNITANIVYNMLNLPQTISSLNNSTYYYDADGNKLRRRTGATSASYRSTDYISGVQYSDNTVLDFIQTEEGRAIPMGSGVYSYEYTLTDHLGNSRVGFDISNNAARIVQTNNYQPFGYEWLGATTLMPKNNYLYNRKEKQENWADVYDYGARFYDPVIGRWNVIDPLAEKIQDYSPYNYGDNNPIRNIDPDGMESKDCCKVPGRGDIGRMTATRASTQVTPSKIAKQKPSFSESAFPTKNENLSVAVGLSAGYKGFSQKLASSETAIAPEDKADNSNLLSESKFDNTSSILFLGGGLKETTRLYSQRGDIRDSKGNIVARDAPYTIRVTERIESMEIGPVSIESREVFTNGVKEVYQGRVGFGLSKGKEVGIGKKGASVGVEAGVNIKTDWRNVSNDK